MVHNHQPAGNFEWVLEEAYQHAYWPFLQAFARARDVRLNLHNSGFLWEFLESRHPEYLDLVKQLVEQGRLELLTGAYYDPILSVIPDEDKVGQIRKMTDFLNRRFGETPRGMWLAERVWEPHLPKSLARAGVSFVLLDDTQFKAAGIADDELTGYYLTEELGSKVAVVPISRHLRYSMPFEPVVNSLRILEDFQRKSADGLIVFADDGEKFGSWPDTYDLTYTDGWLKGFWTALDKVSATIRTVTLSEALATLAPKGRVYLPASSYPELTGWALPPAESAKLTRLTSKLRFEGLWEKYEGLVQGATWRGFLARYPEANRMHKRMLQVATKLREKGEPSEEMLDLLWRSQTSCPFWHGIFGGIYLPHLREAVYSNLNRVEGLLDRERESGWGTIVVTDWDCDGTEEILVQTGLINAYFSPRQGGGLFEFDFKPRSVNLTDCLARWPEACPSQSGVRSDRETRDSFLDRFFDPTADLAHCIDIGEFAGGVYEHKIRKGTKKLDFTLSRHAMVCKGETAHPVLVEKVLEISRTEPKIVAQYRVTNRGKTPLAAKMGVEFNFGLLSGDMPDERYISINGDSSQDRKLTVAGEHEGVHHVIAHDRSRNLSIRLTMSRAARLWRYPVETTIRDIERTQSVFQAVCLMPVWDIQVSASESFEFEIELAVESVQ